MKMVANMIIIFRCKCRATIIYEKYWFL